MKATIIGIDLAKSVFQLCAVDRKGQELWSRKVSRGKLFSVLEKSPGAIIAMESCGGANHIGRQAQLKGFEVRLIAPKFVKPYLKSQKNDYRDAQAICEAAIRPNMRFSAVKSLEEQDIQTLHRSRELLVSQRTMVMNHCRGLLMEYGCVFRKGARKFTRNLHESLEPESLTVAMDELVNVFSEQIRQLDERIEFFEKRMETIARENPLCQSLARLTGVGKLSATALLTMVGQMSMAKNGREFSAMLGLVPRQNSTGGKTILLGITKRGDGYVRKLLIHGARAAIRWAVNKTDPISVWVNQLVERRGKNKAAVALANKNARLIWAIAQKKEAFVW